jgi:hypothetical protein
MSRRRVPPGAGDAATRRPELPRRATARVVHTMRLWRSEIEEGDRVLESGCPQQEYRKEKVRICLFSFSSSLNSKQIVVVGVAIAPSRGLGPTGLPAWSGRGSTVGVAVPRAEGHRALAWAPLGSAVHLHRLPPGAAAEHASPREPPSAAGGICHRPPLEFVAADA